jgi:DNA invertase Pin-like site-specific DNA recombinase
MEKIYFRCSTDSQLFLQQQESVFEHLRRIGRNPEEIEQVVEKVSGTVKHTERKLKALLDSCSRGDVIYISELSRLGRNMTDLFQIVTYACEHGITLIQCKDGTSIENTSIGGKALLFALSLAAEIEVENIRYRTKMGLDARRREIEEKGFFISKAGFMRTNLGAQPHRDMYKVAESVSKTCFLRGYDWRKNSEGYKWVKMQVQKGRKTKDILEEFNELHALDPEKFCTFTGRPLKLRTLQMWIHEMEPYLEKLRENQYEEIVKKELEEIYGSKPGIDGEQGS